MEDAQTRKGSGGAEGSALFLFDQKAITAFLLICIFRHAI